MYIGNIYRIQPHKKNKENAISHPYVVIENKKNTFVVCGITTNMKKIQRPGNVTLFSGEANLLKKSIVDVSQMYVIEKNQVGDFIGKLDKKKLQEILSGIKIIKSLQEK